MKQNSALILECQSWLKEHASDNAEAQLLLHDASMCIAELFPPQPERKPRTSCDRMERKVPRLHAAKRVQSSSIRFRLLKKDVEMEMMSDEMAYIPAERPEILLASEGSVFPESSRQQKMKELRDLFLKLREEGFEEADIIKIIEEVFTSAITPLHVTRDYRLLLPELNNAELQLYPAEKAFYLTFLSYPEGIRFSELIDYREEMLEFYLKVSKRKSPAAAEDVINRLTEQGSNRVNITVTRINKEVRRHCFGSLSQTYGIYGTQGDVKRIALPSDMVCWE